MIDITDKYIDMIENFECDFNCAIDNTRDIGELQKLINKKCKRLLKDIDLLQELSFILRHGQAKIIELKDSDIK